METGVEYELSLGQTVFGQPAEYCALRYRDDFKPSQSGRSGAGSLSIHGSQVRLILQIIGLPLYRHLLTHHQD